MKKEGSFLLGLFILLMIIIGTLIVFDSPEHFLKNNISHNKTPALPTYPAVNISTTLHSSWGVVRINATVPESFAAMPVYRQNTSEMTDIIINREDVVQGYNRDTTNVTQLVDRLPSDSEAVALAEQYLQPYGGVPPDAFFEQTVRSPDIHYYFPNMSSPYIRVYYNQSLSGFPVVWSTIYNDRNYDENHIVEVDIGTNSELIRLKKKWPKTEFVQDEPVITVSEAMEKIELRGVNDSFGWVGSLNVTRIRQGYKLDTMISTIFEPVWIFSGQTKDGHNEELYIPARRNGSATLPLYDYSHPEESIPKPPFDTLHSYERPARDRYVRIPRTVDTVKAFSGNPDLLVISSEPVDEQAGKYGGTYRIYHINTTEGLYRVDAGTGKIMSVYYYQTGVRSEDKTLTFHQIVEKSCEFFNNKFGNCSPVHLASNAHITETPGHFVVVYPISNHPIGLDMDNQSGTILKFYDHAADYPIICC